MTREELRDRLDLGDYGAEIDNGYNGGNYLCDTISEIADGLTSIYYSDIIKFISGHVDEVNDAIAEFGWEGCGSDLYKAGQMAEYVMIERDMEDHIPDIVVYGALCDKYGDEIPEDVVEVCLQALSDGEIDDDWNGRIDTHYDEVYDIIERELGNDEDEEEEDEE